MKNDIVIEPLFSSLIHVSCHLTFYNHQKYFNGLLNVIRSYLHSLFDRNCGRVLNLKYTIITIILCVPLVFAHQNINVNRYSINVSSRSFVILYLDWVTMWVVMVIGSVTCNNVKIQFLLTFVISSLFPEPFFFSLWRYDDTIWYLSIPISIK